MTTQQQLFLSKLEDWTAPLALPPVMSNKTEHKDANNDFAMKLLKISSSSYGEARPLPSSVLQPV